MGLSTADIAAVVEEIAPALTGGWIQKIHQPVPDAVTLESRTPGRTLSLLISADPETARLHLVGRPLPNPPSPPAFCQFLCAHVQGARLDAIAQVPGDRIVRVSLTAREGPCTLVAELTGRQADVLLLDGREKVLASLTENRDRVGQPDRPPAQRHSMVHRPDESWPEPDAGRPFPVSTLLEERYRQREADGATATPALYLPLRAPMRTRGVLVLAPADPQLISLPEQYRLLETFAAQIALALERVHYVEVAQDALVSMESERLRNALLSTLSHDLRTPLTAIVGLSSAVLEQLADAPAAQRELAHDLHEEAHRMSSMVSNLLDMARLQSGSVPLNREWQTLEEVVGSALRATSRVLGSRNVQVSLPEDLPLLHFDAVLLERVLVNLLENVAKYTPTDSLIVVAAARDGDTVRVWVDDLGPGLPPGMEDRIFDRFTRGERETSRPGTGLGLARPWSASRPDRRGCPTRTRPRGP